MTKYLSDTTNKVAYISADGSPALGYTLSFSSFMCQSILTTITVKLATALRSDFCLKAYSFQNTYSHLLLNCINKL